LVGELSALFLLPSAPACADPNLSAFTEVKSAILNHLGAMLERDEFSNRYDFFNNVQALVKAKDFASGKERLSYTFPWYSPADFIIDIMTNVFGKVVKVAIYEEDRTISVGAQDFLKSLAKNGECFQAARRTAISR
jgi:hypothetical protein